MQKLEVTDYNRAALEEAKQATAERMGYSSWEDYKEQNPYDYAMFSGFWEQVSILLASKLTDHKDAIALWTPVNAFVQDNAKDIQIGTSISKHVLKIVRKFYGHD
jgi:hypothetical protein